MVPGTRGDGLRLQLSGVDVVSMRVVGSIPGVVVSAAAARNGTGAGRLRAQGTSLSWQAPGSATFGAAQACSVDGSYLLEDGADTSKWLRVTVYAAFLEDAGEARVFVGDRFNELGPDDVTAAEATAGLVETTQYTLVNLPGNAIVNAKLWIDPAVTGITISSDGVSFFAPTSAADPNALAWATIAAAASVSVWVKRTIAAAAASDPETVNILQYQWTGY